MITKKKKKKSVFKKYFLIFSFLEKFVFDSKKGNFQKGFSKKEKKKSFHEPLCHVKCFKTESAFSKTITLTL